VDHSSAEQAQLGPLGKSATVIDSPLQSSVSSSDLLSSVSKSSVLFLGPAFGETKDALLRRASAFILPSFSEGLPMSVLEAWSYRLPVLMTDHCNLPEGFAADAALRIGTDAASIAESMRLLLRSPISDLRSPISDLRPPTSDLWEPTVDPSSSASSPGRRSPRR
jgi:glycosyltransferase involved in cell wall biosynthesis